MVATLAAALVFVWLLGEVAGGEILRLDTLAYEVIVEGLRSDALTPFMEAFTSLASIVVLAVLAAVIAALAPGKAPGWCVSVNLVCVVLLNTVLKYLVQRPRPDGFRLISESGYSFPSGHSMVAMAFFGLLIWMVWRYHRHDVMRVVWCVVFGLVIVMVGVSRIYLGVHYASDVLAGFGAGLAACLAAIPLARAAERFLFPRRPVRRAGRTGRPPEDPEKRGPQRTDAVFTLPKKRGDAYAGRRGRQAPLFVRRMF